MIWTQDSIFIIPDACRGIGDHLQFTRLPEFYRKEFSRPMKLVVKDKYDIWKYNPDVEIVRPFYLDPATTIDLWFNQYKQVPGNPVFRQISKFIPDFLDRNIRPALYHKHEARKNKGFVAICVEGSKRVQKNWCREIPKWWAQYLVEMLMKKGKVVIQIGGMGDYILDNVVQKCGLSVNDTYELLEECDTFIGVNSGMAHVAACHGHLTSLIYVESDITRPLCATDLNEHPTDEWLYDFQKFVSAGNFTNIRTAQDIIEEKICAYH